MVQAQPTLAVSVSRRQLLGAFSAGLALPTSAFCGNTITYDDVTALPATYDTLTPQQRDKLLVKQGVRELGICDWGCQPLKIWVMSRGRRIDVPLTDGIWIETLDYGLIGRGLLLNSNNPIRLGPVASVEVKPPDGSAVPVGYFLDAMKQINRLIYRFVRSRRGLIASLSAPEISGLDVYFQGPAGETKLQEGLVSTPMQYGRPGSAPVTLARNFLKQHQAGILLFPSPISEVTIAER